VAGTEADPARSFGALLKLERYARIALGAIVDLPWQAILAQTLRIDKAFGKAYEDGSAILKFAGTILRRRQNPKWAEQKGMLCVKASLSGDEDDYHLAYKRHNHAIPHFRRGPMGGLSRSG
jgi:hypothetical protein